MGDVVPKGEEPLTKDSLQTVFVHATRALAAERTTIVLIDDLHFAPEDGRALFATCTWRWRSPGHRVLLDRHDAAGRAARRTGSLNSSAPIRLVADRGCSMRLGPKDLVTLLEDTFRSEGLARGAGRQDRVKSDGNPFFVPSRSSRGLREGQFITRRRTTAPG